MTAPGDIAVVNLYAEPLAVGVSTGHFRRSTSGAHVPEDRAASVASEVASSAKERVEPDGEAGR
jgi:hypothetical protein